ncbi:MAG TPA: hypothetical protein VK768_07320, partial [Chthoniobacterales bacterium]|nr:hypothetical protein [Chthoniobacterales bacterium]
FIEIGRTFGGEGFRLPVQLSVVSCRLSVRLEASMKVGISVRGFIEIGRTFGGNGSRRGRAMEDLPITHQSLKQSASRQPSHRLLTPTNN